MVKNLGHIIDGKYFLEQGPPIEIFNPSNGKLISTITNASNETIR